MVELKPATPADIELIRAMAQRIWWAHYPEIIGEEQVAYMLDLNYSPEALQRQMEEGQVFWLVLLEGEPAGFIAVSRKGPESCFIHKFYLDNLQRGKGLGASAFEALLEQYPDVREARLTVNRQNYKSINFYFKVGFRIEFCLDVPIGEGYVMNDFQMLWRRSEVTFPV